jgi:hypothetical protein
MEMAQIVDAGEPPPLIRRAYVEGGEAEVAPRA